ncbi:MAG TPA: hypothetical protein DF383_12120 [Deltaproteobacteria bacterium]|nr:hypothetical protein [Deltaproteobacteria bacterium]
MTSTLKVLPRLPLPEPPESTTWQPSDTGQFIVDLIRSIKEANISWKGLPVNGGQGGLRHTEIVSTKQWKTSNKKPGNHFDPNTEGDLYVEVRPVEGKNFSEWHRLCFEYNKYPGRFGVRINGFYATHHGYPNDQCNLQVKRDDDRESSEDFRDDLNFRYDVPLGGSIRYFKENSRLVMRPVGGLYGDSKWVKFDIGGRMLESWGLPERELSRNLNDVARYLSLRTKNPNSRHADSCYAYSKNSTVVRPNDIKDFPPLIQYLQPKSENAEIRFRPGMIPIGPLGLIELGQNRFNRVLLSGDTQKTTLTVELNDVPNLRLRIGGGILSARGLSAKITVTLPGLAEIFEDLGLLKPKLVKEKIADCRVKAELTAKAQQIVAREGKNLTQVLDELEAEAARQKAADQLQKEAEELAKKENISPEQAVSKIEAERTRKKAALLQKLTGNIKIEGIRAQELSWKQPQRGVAVVLKDPVIRAASIHGLGGIELSGLALQSLSLEDKNSDSHLSLGGNKSKSEIQKIRMSLGAAGPLIAMNGIQGKNLSFGQKEAKVTIAEGKAAALTLDLRQAGKIKTQLSGAESQGEVNFKHSQGNYSFSTAGSSTIQKLEVAYEKGEAADRLHTDLQFKGKIKSIQAEHSAMGHLTLVDTDLGESRLQLDSEFPLQNSGQDSGLQPKHDLKLNLDVQKAEVQEGLLKIATLGPSTLTNGRIALEAKDRNFSGSVSGTLKLQIDRIAIPQVEFGPPGVSAQGSLRNIGISGSGSLEMNSEKIELRKTEEPGKTGGLKITGDVDNLSLKKLPGSEVSIRTAKLEAGVEKLLFRQPKENRKADLQELKLHGVAITEIEASARIRLAGWTLGNFPLVGKGPGDLPSELRLDNLETVHLPNGRDTKIEGFSLQLFEVGGNQQIGKIQLPPIHVTASNAIDIGQGQIRIEGFLKNPSFGSVRIKVTPRDGNRPK